MKSGTTMVKAWYDWCSGLRANGYQNNFTKTQWISWWLNTEQWQNRGVHADNVCMGRIDLDAPFSVDNVELITTREAHARAAARRRK